MVLSRAIGHKRPDWRTNSRAAFVVDGLEFRVSLGSRMSHCQSIGYGLTRPCSIDYSSMSLLHTSRVKLGECA